MSIKSVNARVNMETSPKSMDSSLLFFMCVLFLLLRSSRFTLVEIKMKTKVKRHKCTPTTESP